MSGEVACGQSEVLGGPAADYRYCAVMGQRYELLLAPGTWTLALRDLGCGLALPCEPSRVEARPGSQLDLDLTLGAAVIELRLAASDGHPPAAERLHVRSGAPAELQRTASGGIRFGGFLGLPGLDIRGHVGPLRLIVPAGACLLWVQRGADELLPAKSVSLSEALAELLVAGLAPGEVRTETLTLSPPFPLNR